MMGVMADDPALTDPVVTVPVRGLVLLIGASGAGKSTFARRHFRPTEILSSDAFRALVSDDENDQTASAPAFDLLHRTLAHRLRRGRLSVVDATNATSGDRRSLLRLAAIARRPAVGIVLDPGEALCVARNVGRDGRTISEDVVRRQWNAVRTSLADRARLLAEGFAALHVLEGAATIDALAVVRDPSMRPAPVAVAADDAAAGPRPTRRRSAPRARTA
jgi:predicted kinase